MLMKIQIKVNKIGSIQSMKV